MTHPLFQVQVLRGRASDEEIAVLVALLAVRAGAARPDPGPDPRPGSRWQAAGWSRLERRPGYRSPGDWC